MNLSRYYLSQRGCPHYQKNLMILLSSPKVAQKLRNVHELPHRDPSTGSRSSISLSLALRQKSLPTSPWWGARLSPSRHASPQPLLPCPGHRPSLAGLYKKTCRVLRNYFQLINYEVGVPATSTHCRTNQKFVVQKLDPKGKKQRWAVGTGRKCLIRKNKHYHLDAVKSVLTDFHKTWFLHKADRFSFLVRHRNNKAVQERGACSSMTCRRDSSLAHTSDNQQ